jgi:hypothetical protein
VLTLMCMLNHMVNYVMNKNLFFCFFWLVYMWLFKFWKHLYLMKTTCCMNAKFYGINLWRNWKFGFQRFWHSLWMWNPWKENGVA